MTQSHSDLTPAEAAAALTWLVDMGADEVLLEKPVNRLVAVAKTEAPPVSPVQPNPQATPKQTPANWQPTAAPDDLLGEAGRLASACNVVSELQMTLNQFSVHPLKKTASNLCFIAGAAQSRILLLCDRPRTEEDRSGEVLAGKHQVLAERMLAAIGLCGMEVRDGAEQVVMASIIPWRPPGNRAPTELETGLCLPFVRRLIEIVQPKAILCFSALPGQLLAGGEESITKARGKWLSVNLGGRYIPLITTFHPETLLKSPGSKRLAWHDLQAFRERLESP